MLCLLCHYKMKKLSLTHTNERQFFLKNKIVMMKVSLIKFHLKFRPNETRSSTHFTEIPLKYLGQIVRRNIIFTLDECVLYSHLLIDGKSFRGVGNSNISSEIPCKSFKSYLSETPTVLLLKFPIYFIPIRSYHLHRVK